MILEKKVFFLINSAYTYEISPGVPNGHLIVLIETNASFEA